MTAKGRRGGKKCWLWLKFAVVGIKSVDSGVTWEFPGAGIHWSMSWLGISPQPLIAPCRLALDKNIFSLQHPQ